MININMGDPVDKPIFLPAELYAQLVTFIATTNETHECLGIGNNSPARLDVVVGLGGVLDIWSEDDRSALSDN